MTKLFNEASFEALDIVDLIRAEPQLWTAFTLNEHDGTLSSGERAMTVILTALEQQARRLDGKQLANLSQLMRQYAEHVKAMEDAAWRKLGY